MNKPRYIRWEPTFYARNLTDVPPSFFIKQHVRVICCDLDNTLAAYDELLPRKEVLHWVNLIQESGIDFILVSNNRETRVEPFAQTLGVSYLAKAGKPFQDKLLIFLTKKGYSKDEVMIVGDQLLTDVWLANRLGIKSMFVEKLVPYDHWPTIPNRFFESRIKRYLFKMNRMHDWRKLP